MESEKANLLRQQKYEEARVLFCNVRQERGALPFGPHHLSVAQTLSNLASVFFEQQQVKKAEPLLKRALAINEKPSVPIILMLPTTWADLVQFP